MTDAREFRIKAAHAYEVNRLLDRLVELMDDVVHRAEPPSLRDEMAALLGDDLEGADAVLAVVRKHYRERIADLRHQWGGDGWIVRYDDLTALFGDDEQIVRAAHQWDERGDTVGY